MFFRIWLAKGHHYHHSPRTVGYNRQIHLILERFDNFAIAGGLMKGEHRGDFSFDDTDPYKIIEGASYSLLF